MDCASEEIKKIGATEIHTDLTEIHTFFHGDGFEAVQSPFFRLVPDLSSPLFNPRLPVHALAIFRNPLEGITRRNCERVSFSSVDRRVCASKRKNGAERRKNEEEGKGGTKKKGEEVSPSKSFVSYPTPFCARQDKTFRSITNETVFVSRCRSFVIAPSMLGNEPFLPDNVLPGSFQIIPEYLLR